MQKINLGSPYAFTGHRASILGMIRSAIEIASAMADSSAGEGHSSQFANFLATRIPATIASTRLSLRSASLPSTMEELGSCDDLCNLGFDPVGRAEHFCN